MEPLAEGDPARVGSFVLRGRLGAGGMGQVFLGRSPAGRAAAVKVVHPHLARQAEFRRRFVREIAAVERVSGAFTAAVMAAGPEDDPPWIATMYVPGPTLAEAVARGGPLPEASVWPLAAGLVEALQAIHVKKLFHRDLKPSNVLLAMDGPRVIDFGIARAMDDTALTGTNMAVGTPGFMSPEQAEGREVGTASDVFALGGVLAFAAGGSPPFGEGPPLAILHRVVAGRPQLDGVPPGPVRDLVAACLAKDPAERPTTAELIERIGARWSPPEDLQDTAPWPSAVTTLIQERETGGTAPYTEHADAEREDLDSRHQQAKEATGTAGPAEAARLMGEVAADRARVLGPDDPATLSSRHEHAWLVGEAGDREEAARLMAGVVADRARVLGPDHWETLSSRDEYVWDVAEAGRREEAAGLMAELIADRARVFGADDWNTLRYRHIESWNAYKLGRRAEAARLMAELAADYERVLGPDHQQTLLSRHDHAWLIAHAGERAEGARLMGEVAADRARVLGPDEWATLHSRHEHAWLFGGPGRWEEAARLMAGVVADRARVLGPDRWETLSSRDEYVWDVAEAGRREEAAGLMAELIADRARVFGADDWKTLRYRHIESWNAYKLGRRAEAARLMAELAADYERVLGPDHSQTLLSRHDHAWLVGEAGERAEAARLMGEVAADRARVLGPDDPATLSSRHEHAWLLR